MDATFEEVVKLAEQLNPDQQSLLIYRLRVKQMQDHTVSEAEPLALSRRESHELLMHHGLDVVQSYHSPTREELIREAETLRQIPMRPSDSLLGKYANPLVSEISEEAFHAQMHAIATEWEQELDELHNDQS